MGCLLKNTPTHLFFFLSLLSFLFSLKENLGFFIILESLNDFPLYLFDIIYLKILKINILRKNLTAYIKWIEDLSDP